jgi:hypothetical protein
LHDRGGRRLVVATQSGIAESVEPLLLTLDQELFNTKLRLGVGSGEVFQSLIKGLVVLASAISEERINLLQLEVSLLSDNGVERKNGGIAVTMGVAEGGRRRQKKVLGGGGSSRASRRQGKSGVQGFLAETSGRRSETATTLPLGGLGTALGFNLSRSKSILLVITIDNVRNVLVAAVLGISIAFWNSLSGGRGSAASCVSRTRADTQGKRPAQSRLGLLGVVGVRLGAVDGLVLRAKVVHLVERVAALTRMGKARRKTRGRQAVHGVANCVRRRCHRTVNSAVAG